MNMRTFPAESGLRVFKHFTRFHILNTSFAFDQLFNFRFGLLALWTLNILFHANFYTGSVKNMSAMQVGQMALVQTDKTN